VRSYDEILLIIKQSHTWLRERILMERRLWSHSSATRGESKNKSVNVDPSVDQQVEQRLWVEQRFLVVCLRTRRLWLYAFNTSPGRLTLDLSKHCLNPTNQHMSNHVPIGQITTSLQCEINSPTGSQCLCVAFKDQFHFSCHLSSIMSVLNVPIHCMLLRSCASL